MIRIPSPPGEEYEISHFIHTELRKFGISSRLQIVEKNRSNVIARINGKTQRPSFSRAISTPFQVMNGEMLSQGRKRWKDLWKRECRYEVIHCLHNCRPEDDFGKASGTSKDNTVRWHC